MTDRYSEYIVPTQVLIDLGHTFTRSDGTVVARIYERLTKRSRRRSNAEVDGVRMGDRIEGAYRKGVYDGFKAMQEELNHLI